MELFEPIVVKSLPSKDGGRFLMSRSIPISLVLITAVNIATGQDFLGYRGNTGIFQR